MADLTGCCEQEVGGVDAGLDQVVRQAATKALHPAVRHNHLDLLPSLPGVDKDLLHEF